MCLYLNEVLDDVGGKSCGLHGNQLDASPYSLVVSAVTTCSSWKMARYCDTSDMEEEILNLILLWWRKRRRRLRRKRLWVVRQIKRSRKERDNMSSLTERERRMRNDTFTSLNSRTGEDIFSPHLPVAPWSRPRRDYNFFILWAKTGRRCFNLHGNDWTSFDRCETLSDNIFLGLFSIIFVNRLLSFEYKTAVMICTLYEQLPLVYIWATCWTNRDPRQVLLLTPNDSDQFCFFWSESKG